MQLQQRPPGGVRLNRRTLVVGGVLLVGLAVSLVLGTAALRFPSLPDAPETPTTATEVPTLRLPDAIRQRPRDYAALISPSPAPAEAAVPLSAPPQPEGITPPQGLRPPPGVPPPGTFAPSVTPPPPATPRSSAVITSRSHRPAMPSAPVQPKKPVSWFTGQHMQKPHILTSPFGEGDDPNPGSSLPGTPSSRQGQGTLIAPAAWERPTDPTRVLYPSQMVSAILLHDVSSDIPGEMRLQVVEEVGDKFAQGQVVIPQYTYVIGQQAGTPKFGQKRLDMTIRALEFPDGTMVTFDKSAAADSTGAAGIAGKVDNHYLQLGLSAVLTALLSVGSQAAVDKRGTFRPTLQEEFARDLSQSVNQTGQQIVKRELERPPTITLVKGTPVILQVKTAVSFLTAPRVVTR